MEVWTYDWEGPIIYNLHYNVKRATYAYLCEKSGSGWIVLPSVRSCIAAIILGGEFGV